MKPCEIISVPHQQTFRWKWRHTHQDGRVSESDETYELFFECVCAARATGYEPLGVNPIPA